MANPFIGEIRILPFTFAPSGWAICQGQTLAISQNDALFALIGTTYGGNGVTTFLLPDLRGRFPIHQGSNFVIGQVAGTENTTLTVNSLPAHAHSLNVSNAAANSLNPAGHVLAAPNARSATPIYDIVAPNTSLSAGSVGVTGGGADFSNIQPYLALNFCISLFGVFPSRN